MPCYVVSREKAASYRRHYTNMRTTEKQSKTNTATSTTATTLVQYLSLKNPNRGEYKYVDEVTLLPFGVEDGSSATFNETYLRWYIAQEMQQYTGSPEQPLDEPMEGTMKIMRIYLKRVFDTVWDMEMKSMELAKNDLQNYYNDDEEDERPVVSSSRRGMSNRKLAKKKQDEILDFNDDTDDDGSDDENENDKDINILQECSDQEDMDDMDDLDIPYTQAITFDPDEFRMDEEGISNEPIRPGDVIEYYSPIYVAGDPRGLRRATVLSIDPKDSMPLVLSNGEGLPKNIKVKRVKVVSGDDLLDHPGIFRLICMFKLRKLGSATAADGIAMETARFGCIMKKNISKMKMNAEGDRFAPMDLLVTIKGVNDDVRGRNSTQTKRRVPGISSPRNIESRSMSSSSSSSNSSSDDDIVNIRSGQKLTKPTNSVARKSSDNKNNGGIAARERKRSLLVCESSSAEYDNRSNESMSLNPGRSFGKVTRCKASQTPKERKAGTESRDYGLDLSLSSDDDSILSILQPTSMDIGRYKTQQMKNQANASSVLDYDFTPDPTTYPVQGLSRTISKSNAKMKSPPSSSFSTSEDSDVEMNILSKPFQIHNKNGTKVMKSMSGKPTHSSESIKGHCKSEERKDNAEEQTSSRETFGWTKGSAGWTKTSIDGSGFGFARFK
jgi:hypothetical protein